MRRMLLSVLLISFVLAGAAGLSSTSQMKEAVSDLRSEWTAIESLPSGAVKTIEMAQLRNRAESLAQRYPDNPEVQSWLAVVVSSHRDLLRSSTGQG